MNPKTDGFAQRDGYTSTIEERDVEDAREIQSAIKRLPDVVALPGVWSLTPNTAGALEYSAFWVPAGTADRAEIVIKTCTGVKAYRLTEFLEWYCATKWHLTAWTQEGAGILIYVPNLGR
jgi:hypothetical protein